MKSIKGFVCVLERDYHGVFIYGRNPEIFEFDPLKLEPFENVSEVLPLLSKAMTYSWNERGYVGYLELEIALDEYDELELSRQSSLIVFWKHWYEKDRRRWRIAGSSGKNVLLTLKPYARTSAGLRKVEDTRQHRGVAILASWRFRVAFDPVLDGLVARADES